MSDEKNDFVDFESSAGGYTCPECGMWVWSGQLHLHRTSSVISGYTPKTDTAALAEAIERLAAAVNMVAESWKKIAELLEEMK